MPRTVNFDIKTEQLADEVYVISFAGEADLYTAPELKQELLEVISEGARQVIVDFSNATLIDSTTLGVLVGSLRRLAPVDGRLAIVCGQPQVAKVFELTHLDRVFPMYDYRDEAVAALHPAAATA
jgi:anti-sigma B factor antagonist